MPAPSPQESASLVRRDLNVVWHPAAQMRDYDPVDGFPPLHVVGAEGTRLHLADGRTLLDAISSWWCKSLGHRHPRLIAALREQADAFEHVILANTTNEPVVRLSERLCALANGGGGPLSRRERDAPSPSSAAGPGEGVSGRPSSSLSHFSKVFYADNGSTAVEIALKMALQAQQQRGMPQRTRLASLADGYHGETAAALSVSDCDLYRRHYGPLLFDTVTLRGLPYRTGPDDPAWLDASAEWPAIEAQLAPHADTLAAIIYEPVLQGAGGMKLYSPDLLHRLRKWADANDVYLIADEIASGFYRLGTPLASHLSAKTEGGRQKGKGDVSPTLPPPPLPLPDFTCLSKGLTGGVTPLSAVLTTDAVYDFFLADYHEMRAFLHSNTYTGHALGVAVANAALDEYEEKDIAAQVATAAPLLRDGLADLARTRLCLHHARGCGMMAAVDLRHPDGSPLDPRQRTGYRIYRHAVSRPENAALLRPIGDTMYLFPPLNTPPEDIEAMITTLADSLDAVLS